MKAVPQRANVIGMFTAQKLRNLTKAQPFRPFRVGMSVGTAYDITNHDAAFVKENAIEIALSADPDGFAERYRHCAILHITAMEELQAA